MNRLPALALVALACQNSGLEETTVMADGNAQAIVSGDNASEGQFPYQVSVQMINTAHFCGGSILDDAWVLTAAHCVDGKNPAHVQIEAGVTTRRTGQVFPVAEMIVHPAWDSFNINNDLALIRVQGGGLLSVGEAVPLLAPDAEAVFAAAGEWATVSGWGLQNHLGGLLPVDLQYVDMPVIDRNQCEDHYGRAGLPITDSMVCAGWLSQAPSSCQGDSGGPLVVQTDVGPAQLGVVSFGIACGQTGYPSVYGRVPAFIDWVRAFVPQVGVASLGGTVEPPAPPAPPNPPVAPPVTTTDVLVSGETIVDVLGRTELRVDMWGEGTMHSFQLDVTERSLIRVWTEGPIDTLGWLHHSGDQILEDDHGGLNGNFLLEFVADAGLYDFDSIGFASGIPDRAYTLFVEGEPSL